MRRGMALAAALALAACAGPQWEKPGISAETAAADYADCLSLSRDATQRDSAIEGDILASRGHDWEKSGTLDAHQDAFAAEDEKRSGDVLGSCMRLRGYTPKT
jgi:hypothetical protein